MENELIAQLADKTAFILANGHNVDLCYCGKLKQENRTYCEDCRDAIDDELSY